MDNLEQIVKQLNNSDLMPTEVANIENMVNGNNQNALTVAACLGLSNAVSKLLQPIVRYYQTERFIPGAMERHAEVNGSGVSTIYRQPQRKIETESKSYYLDMFQKDNFGKSAFDYAFLNEDKSILAKMYLESNDSRIYTVSFNHSTGKLNGLAYFISELCKVKTKNLPSKDIETIVRELSKVKTLAKSLSPNVFTAFGMLLYRQSNEEYFDIFKNLVSEVSKDSLSLCYEKSISRTNNLAISIEMQELLLKYGASVKPENIEELKSKVFAPDEENKNRYAKYLFDDVYTINPRDFKTIVGKSKQVIEAYFKKDYQEVLKEYIASGKVDYDCLLIATKCKYDLEDSRINDLLNLGLNISSIPNKPGENIFNELSPSQIINIVNSDNVELTDEDVLTIAGKSYYKEKIPYEKMDKFYHKIINHQIQGDIEEYKKQIMDWSKSGIIRDFDWGQWGVDYTTNLESNISDQFHKRMEQEKQKIMELKRNLSENIAESIEQKGPKL